MTPTEKFFAPKQLVAELRELHGVIVSERFVRSMIVAGVSPRLGYNVLLSDLVNWWIANPDFAPRARVTPRHVASRCVTKRPRRSQKAA